MLARHEHLVRVRLAACGGRSPHQLGQLTHMHLIQGREGLKSIVPAGEEPACGGVRPGTADRRERRMWSWREPTA